MSLEISNTILIGKKELSVYLVSAALQLTKHDSINIKARGKSINTAVDVSQILTRKNDNKIIYRTAEVELGSEMIKSNDGKVRNVSTISIIILKVKNN